MKTINCFCGASFDEDVKDQIDLNDEPELIKSILDGSFMSFECPKCGKTLRPEFHVKFRGDNIDLEIIPEIERDSFLAGRIESTAAQVVIGMAELREKLLIMEYGYDDRIIELVKLYLLKKAGDKQNITILFAGKEHSAIIFHIYGLKEGETGISKLPESIYNNLEENLEEKLREPGIAEFLSLPYRSINTINTEVQ